MSVPDWHATICIFLGCVTTNCSSWTTASRAINWCSKKPALFRRFSHEVRLALQFMVNTIQLHCTLLALSLAHAADPRENPIFPNDAKLVQVHAREAKLNSGLTEVPQSLRWQHLLHRHAFGADQGMILRYDPQTQKVTVFTDHAGKSNGLAFLADGSMVSCDGADGGVRRLIRGGPQNWPRDNPRRSHRGQAIQLTQRFMR